jgi:hypothetical protein
MNMQSIFQEIRFIGCGVLSNKCSTSSFEVIMLYLFTFRGHARPYLYFLRNVGSVADTMKRLTDMHVITLKKDLRICK